MCVPGAAQHAAKAKPSEVVRCRPGTARGSVFVAVPNQQCTAPSNVETQMLADGGALHCIRDTC